MQKETIIQPVARYNTCTTQYSQRWYEDYILSAAFNLAKDGHNQPIPHCSVLSLYNSEVKNYFEIVMQAKWQLEVFLFLSNESMQEWIKEFGEERISHSVYVENSVD